MRKERSRRITPRRALTYLTRLAEVKTDADSSSRLRYFLNELQAALLDHVKASLK